MVTNVLLFLFIDTVLSIDISTAMKRVSLGLPVNRVRYLKFSSTVNRQKGRYFSVNCVNEGSQKRQFNREINVILKGQCQGEFCHF